MQEEIVDKSVDVAVRITNLTLTQILKGLDAIIKGLKKKPEEKPLDAAKDGQPPKEPEVKHGKQTLKQLHKHNEGLSTMELTAPNLRELHRAMKKADIDFSCVKDGKGKYTLFFKGKNAEEIRAMRNPQTAQNGLQRLCETERPEETRRFLYKTLKRNRGVQGGKGVYQRRDERQDRPRTHQGVANGANEADSRQTRPHRALLRLTGRSAEHGVIV